jgi:hypothetical protein
MMYFYNHTQTPFLVYLHWGPKNNDQASSNKQPYNPDCSLKKTVSTVRNQDSYKDGWLPV